MTCPRRPKSGEDQIPVRMSGPTRAPPLAHIDSHLAATYRHHSLPRSRARRPFLLFPLPGPSRRRAAPRMGACSLANRSSTQARRLAECCHHSPHRSSVQRAIVGRGHPPTYPHLLLSEIFPAACWFWFGCLFLIFVCWAQWRVHIVDSVVQKCCCWILLWPLLPYSEVFSLACG